MKTAALAFTLLILGTLAAPQSGDAPQKPEPSTADRAAVRAIVGHWKEAWDKFDGSVLNGDYSDDADWLNAFGVRKKGNAEIVAFVSQVMKRPQLRERRTTWDELTIRFLRPDVALATRDYQTVGHVDIAGKEMPERRTHATWVLTKDSGKWHIVSHTIQDEPPAAPSNNSQ